MSDIEPDDDAFQSMSHAEFTAFGKSWHAERDRRMRELAGIGQQLDDSEPARRGRPIGSKTRSEFPVGAPTGALDGGS